jgi:hypothetical protein
MCRSAALDAERSVLHSHAERGNEYIGLTGFQNLSGQVSLFASDEPIPGKFFAPH